MRKSCLLVALMLVLMIRSSLSMAKCKKHDLEALINFKHSFTQDPQCLIYSWVGDDCCHWPGVGCDDVTGDVVELSLENPVDDDSTASLVSYELSSSLLELKFLTHLDLSLNDFNGSRIPEFIGSMINLRYLNFNCAGFSGPIPPQIGNLTNLMYLDLSNNGFYVEGRLVYHNNLNGSLPSQLGQLTNLNYLDLSHNEIHGPVPTSIAKLTALKYLDLSFNRLSGLIPDVLGPLTELEYLDISSNSIHGTISHIGNLSRLSFLNMNFNNIILNLATNWRPPFQLKFLHLHSCPLNTAFPQWLRNQSKIQGLDLSYTGSSGEIPQWIWNLTNLEYLQLAGNKLTGSLPSHITCDGCNLYRLDLHNNMLSGTIPPWLKHLKIIRVLDLSENLLSGRILETQNGSSLLGVTKPYLMILDLSDNRFDGEIQVKNSQTKPYPDASIPTLVILSLGWNYFSGLISSRLCHYTNLAVLELSNNHLIGHIPRCLGSLPFIINLGYPSYSGIDIQENIKGTTQNFNGTLGAHSMIDLSCNRLIGTIPEEITNITNLRQLNLSNNHLTGGIPNGIGNLQLLETLDLSNNNLSGTIPQSLSNISWLSVLNLSYNHLYGPIPTGSQLQTLDDPSIYTGNSGLCGFPLPNKCSKLNSPLSPTDDDHGAEKDDGAKDKLDKLWLYLAVMSGVATGFWGVVLTLVFKKSWRHTYFRSVEKVGDRIYVPFKVRMNRFRRAEIEKTG